MSAKKISQKLENLPVWYQPEAPLGSAVHYLAALSPYFNWICISVLKAKKLKRGPSMGTALKKSQKRVELIISIQDAQGAPLGQIEIHSLTPDAFGPENEKSVLRVATELGELWPE